VLCFEMRLVDDGYVDVIASEISSQLFESMGFAQRVSIKNVQ